MGDTHDATKITLQGIADHLGLSRSGVSRALRGHPSIGADTRQRVRQAAEKLGYRPNPYVSALMTHLKARRAPPDHEVIALIIFQESRRELFRYPFVERLVKGTEERARELGYRVEDFLVGKEKITLRRLDSILHHRSIRGLIFAPTPQTRAHATLTFDRYAMIAAGYSLWRPDISRVTANYEHVVATSLRELRRLGYKRIGLAVNKFNDDRVDRRWTGGFLSHSRVPIDCQAAPLLIPDEWTKTNFIRWIRKEKPDAILSPHIEAFHWLREAGISMPDDLGFALLDWSDKFEGVCAGFDQCSNLMGRVMVSQLVTQIERNEVGLPLSPLTTSVKGVWVNGPTITKKPPVYPRLSGNKQKSKF
ncbi:MAG: LacI family DNA-binding transcriptional regulator [Candidatus Methylacidiphilales bacterium]|nr:LacI family DNA-binding transcriptional regulator [Candidatus Methylacidiphilales bacterium]